MQTINSKTHIFRTLFLMLFLSLFCILCIPNIASAAETYTVTYDANGGTFASGSTQNTVVYSDPELGTITKISKTTNVTED